MGSDPTAGDRRTEWRRVADEVGAADWGELTAEQLDHLGEAFFWTNEPWRSVEARTAAHQRWVDAGDTERAIRSAWHVFYEHWLVGEAAIARGWLARARRLVADPQSLSAGWLALAEADVVGGDDPAAALAEAERATSIGRVNGDADLTAMGLQAEGRYLLAVDRTRDGLERMDEAMVAVISNEIDAHYVGWIYCNLISSCHAVGDLRRANEWCEAAMRWCADLRDGLLYPGLCRVYSAQLAQRRGDWAGAERDAHQACNDLLAYDHRYAGAAHYVLGDVSRIRGRSAEANERYRRSLELGYEPQPGLALLRASEGHVDDALAALRPAVDSDDHDGSFLPRLERLVALAEVADRAGDFATLTRAADATAALAEASRSEIVDAYAAVARGRLAVARGDAASGAARLRRAVDGLVDLGFAYDAACVRLLLADVAAASGDEMTAEVERAAAEASFDELGVNAPSDATAPIADRILSGREVEVLRLVAEGKTNRDVAASLILSEHTVARHLGNIYTKLGVRSRTAAVTEATSRGELTAQD